MARYLLRDGNKICANIDPYTLDTFIYRDGQGNDINALLSVKAERQLLKTIQMPSLPIQARMQLAMSRISA
jgi:hypothetical protein